MSPEDFGPSRVLGLDLFQVKHALKTALAAVAAWVLAGLVGLEQGYWAVITVLIVMQSNLGGSVSAGWSRFLGTAVGAVLGALTVEMLGPGPWSLGLAVFLTILVCSYLVVLHQSFRMAGITAAIVIFLGSEGSGVWVVALNRFLEISLGIFIALAVSVFVWPSRARTGLARGLARALNMSAELLTLIVNSHMRGDYEGERIGPLNRELHAGLEKNRELLAQARREPRGVTRAEEALIAAMRGQQRIYEYLQAMDHAAREAGKTGPQNLAVGEIKDLAENMAQGMNSLARVIKGAETPNAPLDLEPGFKRLEERLMELRKTRAYAEYALEDVQNFFTFAYNLKEAARELGRMAAALARSR